MDDLYYIFGEWYRYLESIYDTRVYDVDEYSKG